MEENKTVDLKLPAFVLEGSVLLPGAVARLETDPASLAFVKSLSRSEEKRVIVIPALMEDCTEFGEQHDLSFLLEDQFERTDNFSKPNGCCCY